MRFELFLTELPKASASRVETELAELPKGTSTLAWNGRRSDGSRAPGGIYFYRLTRPGQVMNRRVVLLGSP